MLHGWGESPGGEEIRIFEIGTGLGGSLGSVGIGKGRNKKLGGRGAEPGDWLRDLRDSV